MINLDDFVKKWDGKYLEFDGAYPNQCVDLAKQWEHENGWPIIMGNACKEPDNADKNFYEFVATNPKPGDLVIWSCDIGGGSGHIAIYLTGDENNFTSFDENFPIGSPCHKQNHNYKSVLGYLCPKGNQMDLEQVKELLFTVLEPEWQEWNNRKVKISEPTMRAEIADRLSRWSPTNKWVFADLPIKWRETRQKTIEKCPVCQPPVVSPALPVKDCTSGIAGAVKAEQNRIFNNLVK